jgi:hypothetical protein
VCTPAWAGALVVNCARAEIHRTSVRLRASESDGLVTFAAGGLSNPRRSHGKLDTRIHSRARFSSRNLKLGCTGLAWEPGLRSDTLCANALTFRLRRNRGPMSRAPPNKTSVQKLTAVPQVTQGTEKKGAVGRAAACHSVAGDAPQISQNSLKSWIWLQNDCQHLSA